MEAGFIPAGNGAAYPLPQQASQALPAAPGSKVIRAPGLKRGKPEETISNRIKLESVFGLTVTSNAALDADPNSEVVAYPAGCTVVLYNTRKNRQNHILSASRKTITCVAFSGDGRYLATGECGHAPCVRIWDLQYDPQVPGANGPQVAEFPSHKYGVNCVSFSVNSKYLVSVGSQHDMIVNVWEWRAGLKFASNKVSSKVRAVSFNESGDYFVTVGNRHVKFWYLQYSRSTKYKEPVPLMGRSAILGELRNNDFCDVACGRGTCADSTYAITKGGLLCEFNNRRLLDKWVELRTPSANCMSLGTNYIFVGCAEGIVRCFSPETLQFVTTLPRTHYLGVDVSQGLNISHMFTHPPGAKYPDTIALTYDEKNQRLTCVYNDHSLYVWDVKDIKRVGKSHSALYHTACIWGVEVAPEPNEGEESPLPPGSFLTCSSDDTVRIWGIPGNGAPFANIYSDELHKILYMDPDHSYLKNVDISLAGEKDKPVSYDGKNGVRCMRISADGQHLASGDRAGNVRVHDFNTMSEVCRIEAHNAEVLCLEYSGGVSTTGRKLLASASRDRLIHVFDVDEGYNLMQTLEDHSASITAVRFLTNDNNVQMVSCGADKAILFRQLVPNENGSSAQFIRGHNCAARSTLYDMEVDAGGRHVLVACQDRSVRVYSTRTGRHTKSFRGSVGDDGSLIKMVLDRTGIYVATSCTNKSLCVYDYYSGECMATMFGHSEVVTGLSFTADCQHLISASGDGCIFVWKVPHDMVVTMRARLAQQAIRQKRRPASSNGMTVDSESERAGSPMYHGTMQPSEDPLALATRQNPATPNIPQLDLGRLPSWAQKTIAGDATAASKASNSPLKAVVRGKWAQRAEKNDYKADYYMEPERPMESDGSKDSSLDSGTDTRLYLESKQEAMESLNKLSPRMFNRRNVERPRSLNLSMLDGKMDSFDKLWDFQVPIIGPSRKSFSNNEKKNKPFFTTYLLPNKHRIESDYNENVPTPTKFPRGIDRVRHHTDDSSLGSFKYEDHESTEHDGDVEDISDGERTSSSDHNNRASDRIIYYPTNEDNTPSEFTVNAMDVEELRQSQRRMKKPTLPLPIVTVSATSVSGSGQDSDDDDDETSTPSGDNADRNPLSGSCESLERIAQRESFLKSAFDSLSGAEIDYNSTQGKSSISSQHRKISMNRSSTTTTSSYTAPAVPPRNAALISAAKQTLTDPGTTSKRQELNRRIAETRKQLESVGRSKLKASQSTMDLSYRNDRDSDTRSNRQRPVSQNISGPESRGYSEKCPCNPPYSTTNNSNNPLSGNNSSSKNDNIIYGNNNENFFDSLNCNDLNRNQFININNKNPYDIPANLNNKYLNNFSNKLDDINTAAREFIKKRHEQFEVCNKNDKSKANISSIKPTDKGMNSTSKTDKQKGFSFTIDFGPVKSVGTKTIDTVKGNKVFDRLFPNANQKTDSIRGSVALPSRVNNTQNRNFTLNLTPCGDGQNSLKVNDKSNTTGVYKGNKSRSILKNYKSCPVSPVSEECKWGDINAISNVNPVETSHQNFFKNDFPHPSHDRHYRDTRKRNSLSYFMDFDTTSHLMKDNGKSLVDTIKSDTEKMIAEITKKYGDLDDYEPNSETNYSSKKEFVKAEKNIIETKDIPKPIPEDVLKEKDDGNFSSDSLEDCSLSQDFSNKNKVFTKRICKKHHKITSLPTISRRCVSDYEIYNGIEEKNANYINQAIDYINAPAIKYDHRQQQKSFTLPKNMPSNLDDYADEFYDEGNQDQINNQRNNNFQRCCSALTKRCVTRSNESILTDENSNCSSISNEIFLKYGDQSGFAQRKLSEKHFIDDSQNCSYENLCYEADASYLEKHRHSSASFFLNQRKNMRNSASQESILSDDLLQSDSDNQLMSKTNCNSLESILSDDSEYTKSAPLEILFEHRRHSRKPEICSSNTTAILIPKSSQSCYEFDQSSKSYGSSPNNPTNFGTYMLYHQPRSGDSNFTPRTIVSSSTTNATYGFHVKKDEANQVHKSVTRSISLQEKANIYAQKKNIAYYFDGSEIREYDTSPAETPRTDEIPSMKSKNEEYESNQRKSISTNCENKFKYLCNVEGMETSCINKSKSCSFEVLMEPPLSVKPIPKRITEKTMSHVQKNLEKFESQIRKNAEAKMQRNMINRQSNNCSNKVASKSIGVTKSLERNTGQGSKNINGKPIVDFVPHKPPKPVKRTSSVKLTNRNKFSKPNVDKYPGLDTGLGANVRAKIDGLHLKNSNALMGKSNLSEVSNSTAENNVTVDESISKNENGEKSFHMFVAEKDVVDNKSEIQMDSLEYIANQRKNDKASDFSLDSLDILDDRHHEAFSKDSLNYESYGESSKFDSSSTNLTANNHLKNTVSNKNMPFLKSNGRGIETPSTSEFKLSNLGSSVESISGITKTSSEDATMFKDIERKINIINKLVEMEEKKILQEKYLKECRMRPLKANFSDGKGTVKILSRNFEKLASKHQNKAMLDAADFFSLTYDEFDNDVEKSSIKKEIRRNRSLPDVLDSEKVDLLSCLEEKHTNNECGNISNPDDLPAEKNFEEEMDTKIPPLDTLSEGKDFLEVLNNAADSGNDACYKSLDVKNKDLKQRVYNLTVIPKTDIHLDSENYESSTTSSSCANSPKRLFFGSKQKASSKISSLFRNKFDRGRIPAYLSMKMSSKTTVDNTANSPSTVSKIKPVIIQSNNKTSALIATNGGLARKLSLQQPALPSKLAIVQGSRNRLTPNDFNSLIDDESSGLRRAISLSDLAFKPSPTPRASVQGKSMQGGSNSKLSASNRNIGRHSKQSNMTRSSSVGVLNQSDSESEASVATNGRGMGSRVGGLMRPTISSQNKAAVPAAARRRVVQPAFSSVNLSSVGQEDSSSEETGNVGGVSSSGNNINKPIVPPRPSRTLVDSIAPPHRKNMGRSGSDRDLSSKAREVTNRLTAGVPPSRKHSVPTMGSQNHVLDRQNTASSALDSRDGHVTPLACQQLAQQLTKLTAKIVQMYSTLSGTPLGNETIETDFHENAGMLQGLEAAMLDAQKMLAVAIRHTKVNGIGNDQPISLSSSSDGENGHEQNNSIIAKTVNNVTKKLDDLVSKGLPSKNGEMNQGQAMSMMDQYSDILYTMVNNIGTTNSAKNYSGNPS